MRPGTGHRGAGTRAAGHLPSPPAPFVSGPSYVTRRLPHRARGPPGRARGDVVGVERPADGGPADAAEQRGDLRDGVLALAVAAALVVQLAGMPDLRRGQPPAAAAAAAPGAGGRQALVGALHAPLPLELVDRGEHGEDPPP